VGRFPFLAVMAGMRTHWLFGASCTSPFGPSASPTFALASCLRSRRIRRERIRAAAGRPRSAQREGVWPMDGPNNPRGRHATAQCNDPV